MSHEFIEEQKAITEVRRVASIIEESQPKWAKTLREVADLADSALTLRRAFYSNP